MPSNPELKREWQAHPCTCELVAALEGAINATRQDWGAGKFTGASADETIQLNAKAIGMVTALEDIVYYITEADTHDNNPQ